MSKNIEELSMELEEIQDEIEELNPDRDISFTHTSFEEQEND